MIGSLFRRIVHPPAERSAEASDNSKACSTFRFGSPSISRIRPEKCSSFLLFYGQITAFYRSVRNGIHQISQGNARLHLARKAYQHRFGHIQGHNSGCCGKRHEPRPGRKRDSNRKARMRVAAGAYGIGQQHAVQPGVNNAVAGRRATPPRVCMKSGSVCCVSMSTGFG